MIELINNFFPIFFFTDAFIYLFNWIIKFLNNHYPLAVNGEAFLYYDKSHLNPEYEIQTYVIMIGLFILLMLIYHKLTKINYLKANNRLTLSIMVIKGLLTLFLISFFVNQLGTYPLRQDIPANNNFITYYLLTILILIGVFSFIYSFWKRRPIFLKLFFISTILLIAVLTFISKLPIYFHDFSFFVGPITEIAKGKTIFSQVFSSYSFIGVLLLGYLTRFSLFDIVYFPLLIWLLYVIQYFICFYLILKISDSVVIAVITLFSLLTINYYSLMHFPTLVIQIGPIRWLPLILSIYFLYHFKNIQSKKYIFILAFLSFFTIDSGLFLIISYGLTMVILFLFGQLKIQKIIKSLSWLLLSLILIYVIINITNVALGYRVIDFNWIFQGIRSASINGLLTIPMEDQSYFWLVILIYFASLVQFISNQKKKLIDIILLFSTNLTAITAIYFVGRSHPHNLLNISILIIINFSILITTVIKNTKTEIFKSGLLILFLVAFIVFPAISRNNSIEGNITNQLNRMSLAKPFEPEMISIIHHQYDQEVALINSQLSQKEILLISPDDAYLFYLLKNKTDLIDALPQTILFFKDEENKALKRVFKICPKKIVVDCRIVGKCADYITLNSAHYPVKQSFEFEKSLIILRLKTIKGKCHLDYQPTICTQKLCIMKAI